MQLPIGPTSISTKNQITIPVAVMKAAGLTGGDDVWFEVQEDGTVKLYPAEAVARRWAAGAAAMEEQPADEPPTT